MEYRPRYSQPFTLEEARLLEVPIISEEISRLQNSLAHLQRTQDELQEALATSPGDVDLTQAFEENEDVIGSQKERISILRMVLAEKGAPMGAHYDLQPRDRPTTGPTSRPQPNGVAPTSTPPREEDNPPVAVNGVMESDDERGVYL